jgi:tRNA (guanine37-N1)-methyltransferase
MSHTRGGPDPVASSGPGSPPAAARPFRIEVFTIFPEAVAAYGDVSILGRARRAGLVDLRAHDLRQAATDVHRSVDDQPFGGGAGMVMAPAPVFGAVEAVHAAEVAAGEGGLPRPLLLLAPSGRRFDQRVAEELAALPIGFSLLCGRYEGVDERIAEHLVDGSLSVGDFVLAGGELAALAVAEAVARLRPGVLGNDASPEDESFAAGLLEYPQYTRPASFRGWDVPAILRSGDHARIAAWRRALSLARTLAVRPDLVAARGGLSPEEVALLDGIDEEVPVWNQGHDR